MNDEEKREAFALREIKNRIYGDRPTVEQIEKYFDKLAPLQQLVLTRRYGLFGSEVKTLREVGEEIGRSYERARQRQRKAEQQIIRWIIWEELDSVQN